MTSHMQRGENEISFVLLFLPSMLLFHDMSLWKSKFIGSYSYGYYLDDNSFHTGGPF